MSDAYKRALEAVRSGDVDMTESRFFEIYGQAQLDILSRWLGSDVSWPDGIDWDRLVAPRATEWFVRFGAARTDLDEARLMVRSAWRNIRGVR